MVDIVIKIQKKTLVLFLVIGVLLLAGNERLLKNSFRSFTSSKCDIYASIKLESLHAIKCMSSVLNFSINLNATHKRGSFECKPGKVGFISLNEDTAFTDICYHYGFTKRTNIALSKIQRDLIKPFSDPVDVIHKIPENETFSLVCPGIFTFDEMRKINILTHPRKFVLILSRQKRANQVSYGNHSRGQINLFKSLLPEDNVGLQATISQTIRAINNNFQVVLIEELIIPSLILLKRKLCWELWDIVYFTQSSLQPVVTLETKNSAQIEQHIYNHFYQKFLKMMNDSKNFREEVEHFQNIMTNFSKFCKYFSNQNNVFVAHESKWNAKFTLTKRDCSLKNMPRKQVKNMLVHRLEVMNEKYKHSAKMSSDLYKLRIRYIRHYKKIRLNGTSTTIRRREMEIYHPLDLQNGKEKDKRITISEKETKSVKGVISNQPINHEPLSLKEKLTRAKMVGARPAKLGNHKSKIKIEIVDEEKLNRMDNDGIRQEGFGEKLNELEKTVLNLDNTNDENINKGNVLNSKLAGKIYNDEENLEVIEGIEKQDEYTIEAQNVGEMQKESIPVVPVNKLNKPIKAKLKKDSVELEPLFD